METRRTQNIAYQPNSRSFASVDEDGDIQERLNAIIAVNREIAREKKLFRTHTEEVEAALMKNPISVEKAFAYFGLMLGTFPPASMFYRFLVGGNEETFIIVLAVLVNLICAVAGYFSGKLIGRMVSAAENYSWSGMLVVLPFIGILWGIITGGAGGVIVYVIGALFGAIIAALVGSVAVPTFTIFHRLLKRGKMIELKSFLPLSFGITFIISAFILGL